MHSYLDEYIDVDYILDRLTPGDWFELSKATSDYGDEARPVLASCSCRPRGSTHTSRAAKIKRSFTRL